MGNKTVVFGLGIFLGVLLLAAYRVATYEEKHTHYHANFALYINGKREEFKAPKYYQEVAVCKSGHEVSNPQERAHMHDNKNSLVHVHDHAVTWGQFFDNLGWIIGPDFIVDDNGNMYKADETNEVNIMIDGQDYTNLTTISNMVVKDTSKLLISYGPSDSAELDREFKTIPSTAKEANVSSDPATCASREALPFSEKLKHAF